MKQLLLILAFLLPLCAYPQLKEPFNGPEITSDNPWTGDLDCFVIENGWLVSRADPTRKSVSIETPLVYSATMEWEFEIRMDFKPSDQNHIRLHVYLDDQRMLGLKNDYYVQIGSNKKTITFRKHTATEKNPKILIEKALDVLLGAVDLKVKLTLENHKIWNLYVLEKGRFVLIGSCESEVSSSCKGGQLRFECRYSKTRVNDFACNYIIISDNISIEPEKPDTPEEPEEPNEPDEPLVLPRLLAIQPITESVFQLQYNLPVDIREAIFSISGIGNASRMTYADDMRIHVNISFDKELKVGMGYDLLCSGLMDLEGNKIPESSTEIRLEYEEEPDAPEEPEVPDRPDTPHKPGIPTGIIVLPNEIVFNELLPNPYPEGSEYIELYNRSDRALPLAGLSVATRKSDGTLSTHYPLSSIVSLVEPQDYALLTKSMGGVSDFYLISSPDALHELKLPVLANTSATLVLFRTEDEVMIDEIRYTSKWHAPSVKNEKGIALERINPDSDTQDEMNWTSASATAGYGTPGYRNSQYGKQDEGEVTGIESPVYSEATKEYTISYHLDESGYTCRAWIFDISGRRISEVVNHDLLGIEGELAWNGLAVNGSKVRTGVYIFYAELVHPQGQVKRYKEVFLVK